MLFQRSTFLVSLGALVSFSISVWAAPARITVLGPDAKPLAGASVRVFERLDYFKELPTRNLVTDENGVLILEIDEGEAPRHSYAARVLVPGFAVVGKQIEAGETKIQLQAAQKWGGVVLDDKQKPVAGVRLRLSGWRPEKLTDFGQNITLDASLGLEAVTDAQGRYDFDNLPTSGRASIEINDPRFQNTAYNLDLTQKEAPPLFVKAGGTVTGRIVTPDGKPLGSVSVAVLTSGAFKSYQAAPDGTFTVGGLKPDASSLRSFGVADGWVLKELPFEPVKGGETRRLPDWVATRALEVSGQLIDATTKMPLAGVSVEIQAEAGQRPTTDAQGRFKTFSSRDIHFLRIRSETYVEKTLQNVSIPPGATQYDFGPIALSPGTRITGTVRDEKGIAPRYFNFIVQNKDQSIAQWASVADGNLNPLALPAGTYTFTSQEFEIVSPKSFEVPATGKPPAPVALVVKAGANSLPTTISTLPSLAGRVVDGAGQPVAGAIVKFKGSPSMGIPTIEAVSGIDGRFNELYLGDEKPQFLGIERPGYVLATGGEVSKVETNWQLGEVSVQPSGQIFSGRVLQAGKPVAGARVALAGNNWREPVLSDASGTFRFEDLPRGELEFLAASATGFTSLKTRGDAKDATLNLQIAPEVDRAELANRLVQEQPARGDWRLGWEIFGAEAMETIALRADKALDANDQPVAGKAGYNLSIYMADLARFDPARLVARGPQLLPLFRAGAAKGQAEATLARVQSASGDVQAQKMAAAWLEREKGATSANSVENVARLLTLSDVAAHLKRPDAPVFLDMALNSAVQLPEKVRRSNAETWGHRTARISQSALELLLQDLEEVPQFIALNGAIRAQARGGDLGNARLNLQKMEALQLTPAIKSADLAEREANGQKFDSGRLLVMAHSEVARALALTDPAGALQLAQGMDNNQHETQRQDTLLAVAQRAQRNGQNQVATAALAVLHDSPNFRSIDIDNLSRAGAIALSFDAQLGAQLFQKALAQAAPNEQNARYQPTVATWAFENAPFDAALARVVLEREWSWRLPAYLAANAAQKANGEHNYHESHLGYLAWAMSVFDPTRALEWANVLPAKSYSHGQAKALIAVSLLAAPEQRQNFNRYLNWEAPDY